MSSGIRRVVRSRGQIVAFANIWRGADGQEVSVDLSVQPDAPRADGGAVADLLT
jgi:lysylphosphatidylglycerol synthetase-like protein (DUF2156 family)